MSELFLKELEEQMEVQQYACLQSLMQKTVVAIMELAEQWLSQTPSLHVYACNKTQHRVSIYCHEELYVPFINKAFMQQNGIPKSRSTGIETTMFLHFRKYCF